MMEQLVNLKDKVILVAGATVGIGKATAIQLSQLGAKVVLLSSNEERLVEVKKLLSGTDHTHFILDLNKVDEIEGKVKEIVLSCGPLDGLVYCVGVRSRRPLKMLSPKIMQEVLNINFVAFIEMVRALTKRKRFNPGLSVVGVSSISSTRGGAGVTAYASSKAAMESAVRCLAKELANKDIRINTVVPAQIDSPAYQSLMTMNSEEEDPTLNRQYLGLGKPDDVANAIIFLLSHASRFITGSSLPLDGGYLSS